MLSYLKSLRWCVPVARHIFEKNRCECVRSVCTSSAAFSGLSYMHHVGSEPLKFQTIGSCLEKAADKWPGRPFVISVHEDTTLTYSEVLTEADRLAAGLAQCGLQPGDRLGLCAPNSWRWLVTMMAAARAGLVLVRDMVVLTCLGSREVSGDCRIVEVAINPGYQESELEFGVRLVGVKALMMPSEHRRQQYYRMLCSLAPELAGAPPGLLSCRRLPGLRALIMLDDRDLPGTLRYKDVVAMADSSTMRNIAELQHSIRPDSGCNIQFTSGTTGKPKAAYLSHFNYVNNSYLIGKRAALEDMHHTILTQVPLFHAFGLVVVTMSAMQRGATLVLPSMSYNPEESLKAAITEKCTMLTGTPTMYVDLVAKQRQLGSSSPRPSSMLALTGGAPCSPQLFRQIQEVLGVRAVMSIFGMTEHSAVSFQSMQNETMDQTTSTVGHVQEHLEVKVIDADGKVVPLGTPGELCTRGYSSMLGYWDNPEKTAEIIGPDMWLRTGDQFVLQEDGYGRVVGRLKDVIIRGGENIFPKELEDHLNTHPDIIESQVFGVEDERLGEEICACVRLREGASLDLAGVKRHCSTLASFKAPRLLRTVLDFPKTSSGKVQKYRLRAMVEAGEL